MVYFILCDFTLILKTISFIYQGQGRGTLGEGQWLEFQASKLGRDLWEALWVASKRGNQLSVLVTYTAPASFFVLMLIALQLECQRGWFYKPTVWQLHGKRLQ